MICFSPFLTPTSAEEGKEARKSIVQILHSPKSLGEAAIYVTVHMSKRKCITLSVSSAVSEEKHHALSMVSVF